ncbi:MAG: RagB/SusD family nutrient uptake outer membrane protein, partial [Chloroflexi bacterium]|nr:RagB/SusD family nutrient uptake outer membrane protein [Chloroflexota bacterium]
KGTEMRVLAAEAELRGGNIGPAFALLNEARDEYGMAALTVPATIAEAWTTLHHERGAETWLETRRLWDLRRWFAESGPAHHSFLQGRDVCFPISEEERDSNPNLSG